MLSLLCCDQIDLTPTGRSGAQVSSNAEKHEFCHIAEVKADPSTIWPGIFSDLVPNEIGLIRESPSLHDLQPFGNQSVGNPKVKMTLCCRQLRHGKFRNFFKAYSRIPQQPLMLRRNPACSVLESPRRIGEDCSKMSVNLGGKILRRGGPAGYVIHSPSKGSPLFQRRVS